MPSREFNAVVTKKGAARARSGHPWIFRSDVAEASGEPGDIVRVVDGRGAFLGRAFYNPKSEITLRIAERQDTPIDAAWFQNRLQTALAYRDTLDLYTDAYRIMHAEADGVPGLIIDRYDDYVVLQIGSAAVERRLEWLLQALEERLSPKGILLRGDSQSRKREGLESGIRVLHSEVPDEILVREGSVNYRARLSSGQKTGGFLDQRENHLAAGRYASGRVLDVFSYAGGFGLHAAHRADSVECVDASGPALELARENAELNALTNMTFTRSDAFEFLRGQSDAGETYDTIILDPPAFAKSRRDLPKARRAYKEINLRAMKLLSPGGFLITCSCSFHLSREVMQDTLRQASSDAARPMRVREWRGQSADHPELLNIPETSYLKCVVLQAE